MNDDIRDKQYIDHNDVVALNFIKNSGIHVFRKHYRQGLRSHIMEVLDFKDVENETKGIIIDGLKCYPKALPIKMLRIFRTRFNSPLDFEKELKKFKIVEAYLAPRNIAKSIEIIVTYTSNDTCDYLLCGLQEHVTGKILKPWGLLGKNQLISLLREMGVLKAEDEDNVADQWINSIREKADHFIGKLRQMIVEANYIPDLAGVGNLLLTRTGDIKLVDINNISKVSFEPTIRLDDKGYPVCDKSIEALSLLEQKLLNRPLQKNDLIYKTFLDADRMKDVQALDNDFHKHHQILYSSS